MPSPFPGMDPYLEDPEVWPDVHHELISTIRQLLNQQIRPKYIARVEERIYMVPDDDPEHRFWKVADVKVHRHSSTASMRSNGAIAIAEPVVLHQSDAIREGRVEIQEVASRRVVTVIEVLSPSNKLKRAAGRRSFMKKRREVMNSKANWVEIDLLRTGTSHPSKSRFPTCQYFVYSSPTVMRPDANAWPIAIEEPLPIVGIPLRKPDPDGPLDLQAALDLAYDRAAYDDMVDYTKDPVPPLPPDLAKWANKLLKQKKIR